MSSNNYNGRNSFLYVVVLKVSLNVIEGNIFDSKCQTLVNTVNCVGVMGKGIALEFKKRFPDMFPKYQDLCRQKLIKPGLLWLYKTESHWVLNFPTKDHWKKNSKIEYLELGLSKFLETYKQKGITSIAFPLLGASNGGIDPDVSLEVMKRYLSKCDIEVEIYKRQETEGIHYVNVYSKSNTTLGRLLSNFAATKITIDNQVFESVESWWYFTKMTKINNAFLVPVFSEEHLEEIKKKPGFLAKKYFRELFKEDSLQYNPSKKDLKKAYICKLEQHPQIKELLLENKLPFKHYYIMGGKKIEADEYKWTVDLWDEIKQEYEQYK